MLKKIKSFLAYMKLLQEANQAQYYVNNYRKGLNTPKDLGIMTPEERRKYLFNS